MSTIAAPQNISFPGFDNQFSTGSGYKDLLNMFNEGLQFVRPAHQQYQPQATGTLEERLSHAKDLCKRKIAGVAMHLSEDFRRGFFIQIDSLMDAENWEEDDKPITEASFTTLLRMLVHIKPDLRPGLGSTSQGNIIATWTKDKDRLTIECLPEDKVRWVLSRQFNGTRESAAGEILLNRLLAALTPYNPGNWFDNGSPKK